MLRNLLDYLSNPFDRHKISKTHDPIIHELKTEAVRVKQQQQKVSGFPFTTTVGNKKLRKEIHHHE